MGFIKKVVGEVTGANAAADQAERSAYDQAAATRAAAESSAKAAQEAAAQSARQQEATVARMAANAAAADAVNTPLDNPDVQLTLPQTTSAAATSRKKRATFGIGASNTGVNI